VRSLEVRVVPLAKGDKGEAVSTLVAAKPDAHARMWRNSQSFVMSIGWQK
jgi:hypothetical protein